MGGGGRGLYEFKGREGGSGKIPGSPGSTHPRRAVKKKMEKKKKKKNWTNESIEPTEKKNFLP